MNIAVFLILLAMFALSDTQVPSRLSLVDEAIQVPELKEVRDDTLREARARNLDGVLSHVSGDVQVEMDARQNGLPRLRSKWNIDRDPEPFLAEVATLLSLGGRFEDARHTFVAPAFILEIPLEEMATHGIVVKPAAPVFLEQTSRAGVLERVERGMVLEIESAYPGRQPTWLHVITPAGTTGFMHDADTRRAFDTRAYFRIVRGRWMIVGFYDGAD
jgi:hypothetical protein